MPELTYWASVAAWTVMPVVIIAFNIAGFFIIEDYEIILSFMVFVMLVQTGIFVTYFLTFRPRYEYSHVEVLKERDGYRALF